MQRLSGQPHCGISTYRMSALGLGCVETPWEQQEFAFLVAFASGGVALSQV
jgi:hypothetical protein